jgi:hypothetical protein
VTGLCEYANEGSWFKNRRYSWLAVKVKLKQSRYGPGVAQRVPGS